MRERGQNFYNMSTSTQEPGYARLNKVKWLASKQLLNIQGPNRLALDRHASCPRGIFLLAFKVWLLLHYAGLSTLQRLQDHL
jgi:hypothetical protein